MEAYRLEQVAKQAGALAAQYLQQAAEWQEKAEDAERRFTWSEQNANSFQNKLQESAEIAHASMLEYQERIKKLENKVESLKTSLRAILDIIGYKKGKKEEVLTAIGNVAITALLTKEDIQEMLENGEIG